MARQDTVTQLIAAVRRVGREAPGAQRVIAERCTRLQALTGQGYDTTGKPRIAWDDRQARDELVTALVNDALALLDGLDTEAITAQGGKPAETIALLALVAGQDVEPADDSDGTDGRWRIARKVAPDRVISTVDPDARHAHKTVERRQDGFKAHVVVEPDTGLATVVELTKAAGPDNSDATVGTRLVTADPTIGTGSVEVLGDSACATGDMLHVLDGKQWMPLLKPWPIKPAVDGGFTIDDFAHDPVARTLTCPAGVSRPISSKGRVTFGAACRGCALAKQCTTAKRGRKITLHPHDLLQRAHRQRATDEVSRPSTGSIGPWLNARSRGWSAATAGCPTGASRRTTTGSTTAPPRSTCVASSPSDSPTKRPAGRWPEPGPNGLEHQSSRGPHGSQAGGTTPLSHSRC